jgi:alkylated DNA repair protein alkB family protein 8
MQVYDVIASHFSSTRFAVWPKVRAFIDSLAPGSVVADVGCGNGKYLGVRRDLAVLGCDRSAGECCTSYVCKLCHAAVQSVARD